MRVCVVGVFVSVGVCECVWAGRKCKKKGSKMVNVLNGQNPIYLTYYYPLSDDLFKQLAHYRFVAQG